MDYFPIITSICRASMGSPSVAVINNIKKLIKALEKDNKLEEANKLKDILDSQSLKAELKPSRVSLSKYYFEGERMPEGIKPPVDKESGNYLAEIIFPKNLVDMRPIFDLTLNNSIDYLLEEWMNIEHLNTNNVKPAYSVMLFGEPGTGKTLLAQYLAKKLELPLITAKLDGLLSSFLGTTARNISNLFSFANRYKCVLLLDEFDSIAKLRDDPNELGELKRVVNTLLQCLDERGKIGFTVAITNHDQLLDSAIWRRFDLRIQIPKPNLKIRQEIISSNAYQAFGFSDLQNKFLSVVTEGYSGSDIDKLMNFLFRKKILSNENFNFIEALKEFITLNANLTDPKFLTSINESEDALIRNLNKDEGFKFNQREIAELLNTSQSNISRVLKKEL